MANAYRKTNSKIAARHRQRERRPDLKEREQKKTKRGVIKLGISLSILAVSVFIKLLFPTAAAGTSEQMMRILGEDIDYKAAVLTLGEGLSGEKEFREAVSEACAYAFAIGGENLESTEVITNEDGLSGEEKEEISSAEEIETPPEETDTFETKAQETVAAYMESIGEYAELEPPEKVTYEMPEIGLECIVPASGTLTSKFGYRVHPIDNELKFHYGIDIASAEGTDILSFADGTVAAVGDSTSLGKYLIVSHTNGTESLYAHCSELFVGGGEKVTKGQKIAAMGATGTATASNLHFELTVNDVYVNPQYYLTWQ